ncbi:MAG: hypothetical protein JXR73_04315 [Candidatus Omnitrophica bacterium]|nr:hypothetical protein [Candidatus Omnitrophota bacterium]
MKIDQWFSWIAGDQIKHLSAVQFQFNTPLNVFVCLLIAMGVACAVFLYQWAKLYNLSIPMRSLLTSLRALAILLIFILFLDPCFVGDLQRSRSQTIALLFDDTQSMQVYNDQGETRGSRMQRIYRQERNRFEDILEKKYRLMKYRYGEILEPLNNPSQLQFSQTRSDMMQAIQSSAMELEDFSLSAIILFSDGVQQTESPAVDLTRLDFPAAPIFTVGVGDDSPWHDIQIKRLSVKRVPFDKSPVTVDADIVSYGLIDQQIQAAVLHEGSAVQSQTFSISQESQNSHVHFEFIPSQKEWLEYELRVGFLDAQGAVMQKNSIPISQEERTPQNNSRFFVVDNTPKEYRILYYSSRPNWEHRFVRRALREDDELQLASLLLLSKAQKQFVFRGSHTTLTNPLYEGFENDEEKYGRYDEPVYLRLGLGESELAEGFPREKEDLFSFDLLIFGDVDWTDFSERQFTLIRDFVDQRGGSLLLFANRDALASEAFLSSPIASILPVLPADSFHEDALIDDFFQVEATAAGEITGAWMLHPNPGENQSEWGRIPNLYGLTLFDLIRPGASIYARAQSRNPRIDEQPFFISHRYGDGKCAVIAAGETWPWRMHSPDASEMHEHLWRQWIRSLVEDVSRPIRFLSKQDSYTIHTPATLKYNIRDAQYENQEGARVSFTVESPSRKQSQYGLDESIHETGIYTCEWTPTEIGRYLFTLTISNEEGAEEASWTHALEVEQNLQEFSNAQYNPQFLQTLSRQTNGRFFPINQISGMPDVLPYKTIQEAIPYKIHIWHNPFFYIVFILIVSMEWLLRRKHGHP